MKGNGRERVLSGRVYKRDGKVKSYEKVERKEI